MSKLKQKVFAQNGFESVKNGSESVRAILKQKVPKKIWIQIHKKGFESKYEHSTFSRKWIRICQDGFESMHESGNFPENGFESPKRDSNPKDYFRNRMC